MPPEGNDRDDMKMPRMLFSHLLKSGYSAKMKKAGQGDTPVILLSVNIKDMGLACKGQCLPKMI